MEKEKKSAREPMDSIPFPYCIADYAGTGFLAGAGAGAFFAHFFRGLRDSPCGHHLAGAAEAVREGAPRVATSWASSLGVFCGTLGALSWATGREEDPLVSVASGAVTGALFRLRQGPRAAGRAALVGAATLAVFDKILADGMEDEKNDRPLSGMHGENNSGAGERPLSSRRMLPAMPPALDKVSIVMPTVADRVWMLGPFAFRDSRRFRG